MNPLEELKRMLIEECEDSLEILARGMAEDYPAYRQQVGYIEAVTKIKIVIEDMEKRMEKDDE